MIAAETRALGILARWYAEPLSSKDAQALLKLSVQREQERLKRGGKAYLSPLLRLIALHWLGEPTEGHYHYLLSKREGAIHAEVMKPLIYGQLLMSKRAADAISYLDIAFAQARLLLRPEDYFVVMKRHQLLKELPLGRGDSQGETLTTLLTTAAVIQRMSESHRGRPDFSHDPNDTYG